MKTENLNLEADDLQITPNLNMECLPQMLQECLSVAKTPSTRDMLLMSVLTATSSVMNNVSFRYAHYGKRYYPNLLTFIMAGAASGKGIADLATKLVEPIHQDQPLLIPGDSTYPSFYEQLHEQDGKGLLFETEGSVITDIWKSSCTNYNTALRKCAEHETLSKGRIKSGVTYIQEPQVSMLLTGTCSQFEKLVPSAENGFFSRLNMLMVRECQPFDGSVFMPSNAGQETERIYGYWATQLKKWYDNANENANENGRIEFCLTAEQAQRIGTVMESEYGTYLQQLGDGFHATIVRNATTHVRVACILSVLRRLTVDNAQCTMTIDNAQCTMTCSDEDFETAMVISTKLLLNAADAYNQIGGKDQLAVPEVKGSYQKSTFLASLPIEFSTGECVKLAQQMGVSERMAKYWLVEWSDKGLIKHASHGQYEKAA
ncbi:MAG: DUF3987 domain-containing protein [Paludibacteraceae bacterium]|nr:DUF3987 domain-containing protein [Paludibacteraceae bacterium]